MTPSILAKSNTEAAHQVAFFSWVAIACLVGFEIANQWASGKKVTFDHSKEPVLPELKWIHHVPNGGSRGGDEKSAQIQGARLKAQGVKSGVSDIFVPIRRGVCSGLYIEMKKPELKPKKDGTKGGLSDDQIEFGKFVQSQGYGFAVCYTWEEARDILIAYMES